MMNLNLSNLYFSHQLLEELSFLLIDKNMGYYNEFLRFLKLYEIFCILYRSIQKIFKTPLNVQCS